MVVILKPFGELRVHLVVRCANETVLRERHPILTLEEILHDMFVWVFGENPQAAAYSARLRKSSPTTHRGAVQKDGAKIP